MIAAALKWPCGYRDASSLLRHWLDGGGTSRRIDVYRMLDDLPGLKSDVEKLSHQARSSRIFDSGWRSRSVKQDLEDYGATAAILNWHYALSSYQYRLVVEPDDKRKAMTITVDIFKRYNWGNPNGGPARPDIRILWINLRQNNIARLHSDGFAYDFNVWGRATYDCNPATNAF
jgi:hypothetical protein